MPAAKRRRVDTDVNSTSVRLPFLVISSILIVLKRYDAIDLDDLHDSQLSSVIPLDMKDREKYFEGRASNDAPNGMQSDLVQ